MANPTIDGGGPKLKTQGPSNYWFVGSGIQTNYLVEITGTTRGGTAVRWSGDVMNFASGRHHAIVNFDSRYQKPRDDDDLADVTITVTNDTNSSESVTYPLPPLAPEVVVIDGPGP